MQAQPNPLAPAPDTDLAEQPVYELCWDGLPGDADIGTFRPGLSDDDISKATELRQRAQAALLGNDPSCPYKVPVTVGQFYKFAQNRCKIVPGSNKRYGSFMAGRMARIPNRVNLALMPKPLYFRYFEGWPPHDLFRQILDEVEAQVLQDYEDMTKALEPEALTVTRRALEGEFGAQLQYRAAKDTIERKRGKPTERVERRSVNIDASLELSAHDLAAARHLISPSGMDSGQ